MNYLLNRGMIPEVDEKLLQGDIDDLKKLSIILNLKKATALSEMCTGRAIALESIGQEISSLGF